ncbi:MAG: extracellular solute-binding protein [Anaerolineae bacterium]
MRRISTVLLMMILLALSLSSGLALQAQDQPAITIWTKFNSDNPQNVQDEWMQSILGTYSADTGNSATNVFQPYDQINSLLNLAVQAGGDVPDLSYVDGQYLGFYDYNGTLTDLTEWAQAQSWYDDVSPAAFAACTTPDGRILCIPSSTPGTLTYYWTEYFPDGYPTTAEGLLDAGERLHSQGVYAVTFHGIEVFGLEVSYSSLIHSAGAAISDAEGRAAWANPEMVRVIDYVRSLFANEYAPQIALAGGFDYENAFKDHTAASLLAGTWSYVFLFPVTAPDGTVYDMGDASVLTAAEEGRLGFAPPLAFEDGGDPMVNVYATGWGIPVGSPNEEAAKAFINYTMQTQLNADFAVSYGALPAMLSAQADPRFSTPYWQTIAEYQNAYGAPVPFLIDYNRGMAALADVFARTLADPNLDAMQALQDAQDNYNNSLQ